MARHALGQLARRVAFAVAVDFLAEPREQGGELAGGELSVDVADVFTRLLEKLGRIKVAERVRGKVPDGAAGPVDVLQAAAGVIRGDDAEIFLHLRVPGCWEVGGREI